ncbi:zinc-binding protein [Methanocella sp. CWC-04]|uniref:Zinc-binding protein n=1 Tax=Methanooceanicella nereidis TaxID=2052831 RepID=A0AAP2RCW9_9EURY|nr:putative zinc-binding protein [Methanocella sp. CWC-04]MCD1293957.1 zinc-binding protein [Methanocella sp. CWC-04]
MDNSKVSEKNDEQGCMCSKAPNIIYACSGSADVGEIADRAARLLSADGAGKMSCLAGIGGHISGLLAVAEVASKILVIDGCPMDCGKNTLILAGYRDIEHIRLSDMGMKKGKTPAIDENVAIVVEKGKELLATRTDGSTRPE